MDFQIGSALLRVATMRQGHMMLRLIVPIGDETMLRLSISLSNEQGTNPLGGTFQTYKRGDKREEAQSLENYNA